jgi:hypothetical protein
MTSNSDWVVPVTHDERRYAMLNASDHRTGQREYFSAIVAQMENGGLAAMIWDMLRRNISGFEVRDVPDNAALADQRRHSMDSLQRWWLAVLDRGFLYRSRHGTPWFSEWHEFYTTELLMRSYLQWSADARPYDRKSREQLGEFMKRLYVSSRPTATAHPVHEVETADPVHEIDNIDIENQLKQGDAWLNKYGIVYKEKAQGYFVNDLEIARDRFTKIFRITCHRDGEL